MLQAGNCDKSEKQAPLDEVDSYEPPKKKVPLDEPEQTSPVNDNQKQNMFRGIAERDLVFM